MTQIPFEPSQEAIDLLNARDAGVIGYERPRVKRVREEGMTYTTEHEALPDAGDWTRVDNGF